MDQVVGQALATFKKLKQRQEDSVQAGREAAEIAAALSAGAKA
jgi:hypothetical protein